MRVLLPVFLVLTLQACDVVAPQPEYLAPIRYARLQIQSAEGAPDEVIVAAQHENGLAAGAANAPAISLARGHTYDGRLHLFTSIPPDFETNVTQQIVNSGTRYGVTYTSTGNALTITPTDRDAGGRPIGLTFRMVVADGASGSETVRVRLARYGTAAKTEPPQDVLADFTIAVSFR